MVGWVGGVVVVVMRCELAGGGWHASLPESPIPPRYLLRFSSMPCPLPKPPHPLHTPPRPFPPAGGGALHLKLLLCPPGIRPGGAWAGRKGGAPAGAVARVLLSYTECTILQESASVKSIARQFRLAGECIIQVLCDQRDAGRHDLLGVVRLLNLADARWGLVEDVGHSGCKMRDTGPVGFEPTPPAHPPDPVHPLTQTHPTVRLHRPMTRRIGTLPRRAGAAPAASCAQRAERAQRRQGGC